MPKDVQGEKVANSFRLNKVGVTGVVKPVQVRRPNRAVTLTTTLDVFVDLPPNQKGSHLSRNLEAINEVVDRSVRDPVASLEELTDTIARSLLKRHDYATTSEVWASAAYFLERTSPWGRTSLALSAPTFGLLKRPDEGRLVEMAHRNPKFVEDVVRDVLERLLKRYPKMPDGTWVRVKSEAEESIHKHNAFAERSTTFGELRAM
ncbi:MAG: GTP cyclohydrolase I FolE2 [Methanobacteriota archaeon]|nr:MAG: GTP cyclohydrolase I FolE2 [Euryarchaeota archaeon]